MTTIAVERALISVSDKEGLVPFAEALVRHGVEIVSSGGTALFLADAGLAVTRVAEVTGAPEILGGRVKTLHPGIHGGLLADLDNDAHRADLAENGIEPFQLVVSNLYPFEHAIAQGVDDALAIEQIDIGGPTLIRAAAKNHDWVAVVVSPDRYGEILDALDAGGTTSELRLDLAREAFFRTAQYDAAIANWFERGTERHLVLPLTRHTTLRYGENPNQDAGLYSLGLSHGWWAEGTQLQGKAMSFNNYADADAAWRLATDLPTGSVAIVKHMNACGAAFGRKLLDAFEKAWACDPTSAFGGVVALNGEVDAEIAEAISGFFVEIVIASTITAEAKEMLAEKQNLRVFEAPRPSSFGMDIRSIDDGFLVQEFDRVGGRSGTWESKARPASEAELADLDIAWIVAAHTKSNAVVLVKDGATVGVGAGDQSRVGAAERALVKAGARASGAVCASDAFFPFRDGPDVLAEAGVTAIVEPGGSRRDGEVIESATEHGISLLFTGERHFKH